MSLLKSNWENSLMSSFDAATVFWSPLFLLNGVRFHCPYNMESFCFCSNLKALADDLPRKTKHGRIKCWWQRPPYLPMSVLRSAPSNHSLLPPDPMVLPAWPPLLGSIQTTYLAGCFLWWWLHAGLCLAGCVHARTQPHGPAQATMPNLSQFFPMDMACGPPPRRPT